MSRYVEPPKTITKVVKRALINECINLELVHYTNTSFISCSDIRRSLSSNLSDKYHDIIMGHPYFQDSRMRFAVCVCMMSPDLVVVVEECEGGDLLYLYRVSVEKC